MSCHVVKYEKNIGERKKNNNDKEMEKCIKIVLCMRKNNLSQSS